MPRNFQLNPPCHTIRACSTGAADVLNYGDYTGPSTEVISFQRGAALRVISAETSTRQKWDGSRATLKLAFSFVTFIFMPFRSQNVWRRNFAESICIILLSVTLGDAAETLVVQLPGTRANPELVTINQGDTVVFAWGGPAGLTESYTGEWKSPVLQSGQTFSYTFTNPWTYVYRVRSGVYGNEFIYPGVIRAQPVLLDSVLPLASG